MIKITLSDGHNFTNNFDFWGRLSTFEAINTAKSESFKLENDAQTMSKQLRINFQKLKKKLKASITLSEGKNFI